LPILFEDLVLFAYPMALCIEKPEINVQTLNFKLQT